MVGAWICAASLAGPWPAGIAVGSSVPEGPAFREPVAAPLSAAVLPQDCGMCGPGSGAV